MTLEELFKEAGKEWDELYWQRFLEKINSVPDYDITIEMDKRIIVYIKKLEKEYLHYNRKSGRFRNSRKGLKVLLVAAILLVVLSVSAFSFNPVKDFFYKVYEKGTEFFFNYNKNATDDFLYGEYSFIPKGYELVYNKKSKLGQRLLYLDNNSNRHIVITTNIAKHSSYFMDTEKDKTGEISVNGCDGYYSVTDSSVIVVWYTGKYYHSISADLNEELINLDVVVRIAESRFPER